MYVIDLTHDLDARGAIAPERGPARRLSDFLTAVVAHASDVDRSDDAPGPVCFTCRKRDRRVVGTGLAEDDVVVWRCLSCGIEGRTSNRQDAFRDSSQGTPPN
jgi:hypothetical protein